MKKVLFIYYHFPPIMGDWRGVGFTRQLPDFGWEPVVISAAESVKYQKDYSLLNQVPEGLEIHRIGHHEPSGEWQYIRTKLKINFDFPDYYKGWYSPVLREARRIIQEEKIDLIFSSYPYTACLAAMKLKKEFNIPLVTEWRDMWSGNEFSNTNQRSSLVKPLRQFQNSKVIKAERELVTTSDKIIVVFWRHKEYFRMLHGADPAKIEIITNGYDESDFNALQVRKLYPDKLTITFLGSVYPDFRKPILDFLKAVNEVNRDAEVIFIGKGSAELSGIDASNLTKILHIPKEKALSFANGSDFLLLVMPDYAKWTTLKMYEYFRLGKPILALVPEDGDAAKVVREAKAGFFISHDFEKMKGQLNTIFVQLQQGEFKNFQPDREYVSQFERRNLTRRLADVFNQAVDNRDPI